MPVSNKKPVKPSDSAAVSTAVSTRSGLERHFRMNEAARILGCSRATLYRWLPEIRHRRVPAGGLTKFIILIPETALEAFLAQFEQVPGANHIEK
jgi:excisionase family DNA binding protein